MARVGPQRHGGGGYIHIFVTISKMEGTYGKKLDRSELQEKETSIGKPK